MPYLESNHLPRIWVAFFETPIVLGRDGGGTVVRDEANPCDVYRSVVVPAELNRAVAHGRHIVTILAFVRSSSAG